MSSRTLLPLVPVNNLVVFPKSVQRLTLTYLLDKLPEKALQEQSLCLVVLSKSTQTNKLVADYQLSDFYPVGVQAEIVQYQEFPNAQITLLVEGQERVQLTELVKSKEGLFGSSKPLADRGQATQDLSEMSNRVYSLFKDHLDLEGEVPPETLLAVLDQNMPSDLADLIGSYLPIKPHEKQKILEELDIASRLKLVQHYLNEQIIEANLDKNIDSLLQDKVERERKEMLLKAKLRAIRIELDETSQEDEVNRYLTQLENLGLPFDGEQEIRKEITKLERSADESMEAGLIRGYLDFVFALPWRQKTSPTLNIRKVQRVLDQRHYGLEDVKERIMEHLAVKKLSKAPTSNILCLVGPPGVGKTSIVKSVANALGRKFFRISLGGTRDEADLRGHRRTYVGALPGKIVAALYKAGSMNPVILLDEVDKIAGGFKGDPTTVLMEILDPEQNDAFMDHYLQVPIDLSHVLFVCTANDLSNIPAPLQNRLEIIQISGYGIPEKIELAQRYLMPSQIKAHGLSKVGLTATNELFAFLIANYTSDVGLRELDRSIQRILRKLALQKVLGNRIPTKITKKLCRQFLGPGIPKPSFSKLPKIGSSVALYCVGMVGSILPIEAATFEGSGQQIATGNIDPLLKGTISTAISHLKQHPKGFGLPKEALRNKDVHIHFHKPEFVKKGEGWGLAIFAALLSDLLKIPIPATVAFAGQISLQGEVLPTGDLEQKLLAASQLGITTVIVSTWNLDKQELFIPSQLTICSLKSLKELPTLLRRLKA